MDAGFSWEGDVEGSSVNRALTDFNRLLPDSQRITLPGLDSQPLKQALLSRMLDQAEHDDFLQSLSASDRENMLSESRVGASGFLSAVPSKELGLAMPPAEFLIELKTRLLIDQFEGTSFCPLCDGVLDPRGHHCRLCVAGPDRTVRHNNTRNKTAKLAARAALNPELERSGLLPPSPEDPSTNLRRPADVYLPSWHGGAPAALDFAVVSPQRLDALARAVQGGLSAAEAYEGFKRSFLDTAEECSRQGFRFIPMVAQVSGAWAPEALRTLREICRISALRSGTESSLTLGHSLQQLCIVIRLAGARAVLRRQALVDLESDDPFTNARLSLALPTDAHTM